MQGKPCQTQTRKGNTEAQNIVIGKAEERNWASASVWGDPVEGALLQRTHALNFRDAMTFHVDKDKEEMFHLFHVRETAQNLFLFCILMEDKGTGQYDIFFMKDP